MGHVGQSFQGQFGLGSSDLGGHRCDDSTGPTPNPGLSRCTAHNNHEHISSRCHGSVDLGTHRCAWNSGASQIDNGSGTPPECIPFRSSSGGFTPRLISENPPGSVARGERVYQKAQQFVGPDSFLRRPSWILCRAARVLSSAKRDRARQAS